MWESGVVVRYRRTYLDGLMAFEAGWFTIATFSLFRFQVWLAAWWLYHVLLLAVPERLQEGGTRVIPGHGRVCNEADVVEYRDMVTIVRDRIQDMVKRNLTLEQVKAAKPTLDYDTRYGASDRFVEAVYDSLKSAPQ